MTFTRFRQLWDVLVTDRAPRAPVPGATPIATSPISPHTEAALIRVSEGDHSDFDRINAILAARDAREKSSLFPCPPQTGMDRSPPPRT